MIIILTYHAISEDLKQPLSAIEDPYYTLSVHTFEQQMRYLKESDAEILPLSTAISKTNNARKKKRYVVITFDDGYKGHFSQAKPILEKYGFIGHFFITVENVDQAGYMNWQEIMKLQECGHIIGSHGMTHRILTMLDKASISHELKDARRALSQMLHKPIDYFSVPGGFYNAYMKKMAKEARYKAVLTSDIGYNKADLAIYHLKRIAVRKNMQIDKFRAIIDQGCLPATDRAEYLSKRALQRIIGDSRYHRLRKAVLNC